MTINLNMQPGMGESPLQGILANSEFCINIPLSSSLLIFREELLLELVAGLASGLHHLHQAGIHHGAVCARNVFMVGETGNSHTFFMFHQCDVPQGQSWEDLECLLGVDLESSQTAPDGW